MQTYQNLKKKKIIQDTIRIIPDKFESFRRRSMKKFASTTMPDDDRNSSHLLIRIMMTIGCTRYIVPVPSQEPLAFVSLVSFLILVSFVYISMFSMTSIITELVHIFVSGQLKHASGCGNF